MQAIDSQKFSASQNRRRQEYRSQFPGRVKIHADAIDDAYRRCADAIRPVERHRYETWLQKNWYLPKEFSANPGYYRIEGGFRYWLGPIEAIQAEETEEIVLNLPTQVGKTTFLEAAMGAISMNDPAPGMLAGPDMEDVRKVREDIYGMCDASRTLRDKVPRPRNRNMHWIQIGGCRWHLAWSGNTQRLSGKSCRYVFATEVDKWQQSVREGLTQDLVRERVKAFSSFKLIFESTPTDENSFISNRYDESDQRRYVMPCPHCGHHQELRFHVHEEGAYKGRGGVAGYRDSKGEPLEPDVAMEAAHYICEQGCRIEESARAGMIERGQWVPKGQWVNKRGKVCGKPERSPRVAGYNATSLIGRQVTFSRIAGEFCRSHGNPKKEQNFVNNWEGKRYIARAKSIRWKELFHTLKAGHSRGHVPAPAYFLTAGIDVQDDRAYYVVRAWGQGCTSWLVDWGVHGQSKSPDGRYRKNTDLTEIWRRVIDRDYPIIGGVNPLGYPSLRIIKAGCDTGYEPLRVWNWIRSRPGEIVRAFAGDANPMTNPTYRHTTVEKNARTGEKYPGGMDRWGINTGNYKQDIRRRWRNDQEEHGYWWTCGAGLDEIQSYLQHITNEVEVPKPTPRNPQATSWEVSEPALRWDWWDCEVYARAAADMVTGFEWDQLHALAQPYQAPSAPVRIDHDTETDFSAR